MKLRKTLWVAALAAGLLAAPSAFSRVSVYGEVGTPPPARLVEVVPPPRPGYVWTAGYWGWNSYRWVWISGRFILGQPGYYWEHEHWQHIGGRYRFVPGRWARERHEYRQREHDRGRGGRPRR